MSNPQRTFIVNVKEILDGDGTEYDVRIYRASYMALQPVTPLFPLDGASPRCDSLDAVGDVVRDAVTDGIYVAFYEDHITGVTP